MFFSVFIIYSVLLAFVNDVYTAVYEKELEKRFENNETMILAMEAVDDYDNIKDLRFKNLEKLALEEMRKDSSDEEDEDDEEEEQEIVGEYAEEEENEGDRSKLGHHLLDPEVYLDNYDQIIELGNKGDSLKIIFNNHYKKKLKDGMFKNLSMRIMREIFKIMEVVMLFSMILLPIFVRIFKIYF